MPPDKPTAKDVLYHVGQVLAGSLHHTDQVATVDWEHTHYPVSNGRYSRIIDVQSNVTENSAVVVLLGNGDSFKIMVVPLQPPDTSGGNQ